MFKSSNAYERLLKLYDMDIQADITRTVKEYFQWVMFSHTWEGEEPKLADVMKAGSVWNLELTNKPLNVKLCEFCGVVSDGGYRWAWSDTCCIDKSSSAIESQSIISMYTWYAEAAETIVYLADVEQDSRLENTRWLTRAWTYQELLASKVIRFYNKYWGLYRNNSTQNHMNSSDIKEELARAMDAKLDIAQFSPRSINVREILRQASKRKATVEEDIAYSLIGLFSSDVVPRYGIGKDTALGHLLEGVVGRSGDTSVLAWTGGKPSQYNSALPHSLDVYGHELSPPQPLFRELVDYVRPLSTRKEHILEFNDRITELPGPTFSNRRLHLPCITFSVTDIQEGSQDRMSVGKLYLLTAMSLGRVGIKTLDVIPMKLRRRQLVFVHPWLTDLTNPHSGEKSSPGSEYETGASDVEQELLPIARLYLPFNPLLLERQPSGRYKRIAADCEIKAQVVEALDLTKVEIRVVEII